MHADNTLARGREEVDPTSREVWRCRQFGARAQDRARRGGDVRLYPTIVRNRTVLAPKDNAPAREYIGWQVHQSKP